MFNLCARLPGPNCCLEDTRYGHLIKADDLVTCVQFSKKPRRIYRLQRESGVRKASWLQIYALLLFTL